MANENNGERRKQDLKIAGHIGEMTQAIKDMRSDLKELKDDMKEWRKDITHVKGRLSWTQGALAIITMAFTAILAKFGWAE